MAELLGPPRNPDDPLEQRHKDLARSTQIVYEEAFFALLLALHRRYPVPNLALSGGCAMNSVANGKVYLRTPFRKMYMPAAAGDAGGAIGAAAVVLAQLGECEQRAGGRERRAGGRERRAVVADRQDVSGSLRHAPCSELSERSLDSAYLGPHFSNDEIEHLLRTRDLLSSDPQSSLAVSRIENESELCARTARAIAEGLVIGWFQGRMEWGPRALGNRSILCDPRRADMKEILNAKIKRRESFRPFAPSILREAVGEWFEQDDDVPFMMQVFQVREEKRAVIPAITHVDGSGRLQTVHRETNPLYHQLISEFSALTSVPLVLNTSFNENEPVVCRPEEALDCFLRTKMDILVLGSFFVERKV